MVNGQSTQFVGSLGCRALVNASAVDVCQHCHHGIIGVLGQDLTEHYSLSGKAMVGFDKQVQRGLDNDLDDNRCEMHSGQICCCSPLQLFFFSLAVPLSTMLRPKPLALCLGDSCNYVPVAWHCIIKANTAPKYCCYCRCWLNTFTTLLFSGKDAAHFWHSLKPAERDPDRSAMAVFNECVKLHHTLTQSSGSTDVLFQLIGKVHPKLVTKPTGHHTYQQQDVDEAFTLLLGTLKTGMEQAGVNQQVGACMVSGSMHIIVLASKLDAHTACTQTALHKALHQLVTVTT